MMIAPKKKMGALVSPGWVTAIAAVVATLIIALNIKLLFEFAIG